MKAYTMTELQNKAQGQSLSQLSLFGSDQKDIDDNPSNNQTQYTLNHLTLVYLLAVSSIKGIGFKSLCSIYDTELLWKIWSMSEEEITASCNNLPTKVTREFPHIIYSKKAELLEKANQQATELYKREIYLISSRDVTYPNAFKKIPTPPRWFFIKGNRNLIYSDSIIALVGTREPSNEGHNLARRCAEELAKRNFVVLSGLARGIDSSVHSGAVGCYGESIAILGHGLELKDAYQNENLISRILEMDGAILSEYMLNEVPSSERFLRRNELIAALAKVVIPVEMPSLESGTSATVRRALKLKTQVIGITSPYVSSKFLDDTVNNLKSLNIPIYAVGNGSNDFWRRLEEIYPKHDWNLNSQARQDRFFKQIIQIVVDAKDKIVIDSKSVDRLAMSIKDNL